MIYQGPPAIFLSAQRAYMVEAGQAIPKNATRLAINYPDRAIVIAVWEATTGANSTSLGRILRYGNKGVVHDMEEELFSQLRRRRLIPRGVMFTDFENLRHALGSSHLSAGNPHLGWRNYYAAGTEAELARLVEAGLMKKGQTSASLMFHATEAGLKAAGATYGREPVTEEPLDLPSERTPACGPNCRCIPASIDISTSKKE